MIYLVLFCVLTCLCTIWGWMVYVKGGKHELPPFYPGLLPIVGHFHLLIGDDISFWRFTKNIVAEAMKHGGVITVVLGYRVYYIITDPEDALTAANACLQKHFAYDYAKSWLGDGLITSSGEVWRRHRKLLTPAFSLPMTLSFLEVFNSQSRKLVESLKVHVSKEPFDHTKYFRSNALETFCLTSFGLTGFEDSHYIQKYMHAVDEILSIITQRFQKFWLQSDTIFNLCGFQKRHDELVKILNDMSDKVIQRKKAARSNGEYTSGKMPHCLQSVCTISYMGNEQGPKSTNLKTVQWSLNDTKYKPFLDLLLESSEDNALTDKEIREEVDTAIVAGFDTSSGLLSYMMILLGTHPEVQDKIYQEIKEVFATDRDVEKEDLQKLVYTEAVIKESLRIFPIGPSTLRYVDKDVRLKNFTMRAGSQCAIMLFGAHLQPVWGKDVEQFRPERWLDPGMPANPGAFLSFSLGKRSCLGKAYAMISMKATLVHFLRKYKVTADDSNLQLRLVFMLKPVSGHEITLEERM